MVIKMSSVSYGEEWRSGVNRSVVKHSDLGKIKQSCKEDWSGKGDWREKPPEMRRET